MPTPLKTQILNMMRNRKRPLTVGEIDDLVIRRFTDPTLPSYDTVRGRVYDLANEGKLSRMGSRKDSYTGRWATTFAFTKSLG